MQYFFFPHCSVNASVVYLLKWFKPCSQDKFVHFLRGFILITLMTRILNTSDTNLFLDQLTQVGRLSLLWGHKTCACCHFPLGSWEKEGFKSILWAKFEIHISRLFILWCWMFKKYLQCMSWDSEKLTKRQYFCRDSSFLTFQKTLLQKNPNNKPEKIINLWIFFCPWSEAFTYYGETQTEWESTPVIPKN